MKLLFENRPGYLLAVASGQISAKSAKSALARVIDWCRQSGIDKALLDCRELTGTLSTLQRFELGELIADLQRDHLAHGARVPVRLALVGSAPLMDDTRFIETVATNRGAPMKSTTDMTDALAWLEQNNGN